MARIAYSLELAEKICAAIACSSDGLQKICKENEGFPDDKTVYKWLGKHPEFQSIYTRARAAQAEVYVEETIKISDAELPRKMDGDIDSGAAQYRRLQVDTRKWIASKMIPRVYGDKLVTQNVAEIKTNADILEHYKNLSAEDKQKLLESIEQIEKGK